MVVAMADDTIREVALEFVLQATDLLDDELGYESLDCLVTDLLAAAERVAKWLATPVPGRVTQLVLRVGPVTEQT